MKINWNKFWHQLYQSASLNNTAIHIFSHQSPDGDSISSQLVLASLLKRFFFKIYLYSKGPYVSYLDKYQSYFLAEHDPLIYENNIYIIVDASDWDITGFSFRHPIEKTFIIDHHSTANPCNHYHLIQSQYPANVQLIYSLFQFLNLPLTYEEKDLIYMGIFTDTGGFRFLSKEHYETFSILSDLTHHGVSPNEFYYYINQMISLEEEQFLSFIIQRIHTYHNNQILLAYYTWEELYSSKVKQFNPMIFFDRIQNVNHNEFIILIKALDKGRYKVSLRSRLEDLSPLVNLWGGGGHKHAAGFSSSFTWDLIESKLIQQIEQIYSLNKLSSTI